MPLITYDTSIFTTYKPEALPSGFLFSAVVIQELIASANDDSEVTRWTNARRAFEREDRLIVPNSEDWLMASKVLDGKQSSILADAGTQEKSWRQISAAKEGSESAHGARCAYRR